MEIPQKLLKLKFHISFALAFSIILFSLLYIAPSFLHILAFFWPLLVSTSLFLATVAMFSQTSPLAIEAYGEKAGEGILDFVAGQPEQVLRPEETHKFDST